MLVAAVAVGVVEAVVERRLVALPPEPEVAAVVVAEAAALPLLLQRHQPGPCRLSLL